jgi:hypothetical protein
MNMAFGRTSKTLKRDLALAAVVATTMTCVGGHAQTFPPEDRPCPTSKLTQPQGGLAPIPALCATQNCLVSFKGYQWWTSYQFPFFNDGLRTPFAPDHAFIGDDGNLHLMANNDIDLGAGKVWSGAEAVLMFNGDGSEANLGYGDYLVTAKLVDHFWSDLDPNMAFGVFTYENPGTGPNSNPNREMDLAELSRWGRVPGQACRIGGVNNNFPNRILCKGDAQFALQKIDNPETNGGPDRIQGPLMVDRYNIGDNSQITLVMRWRRDKVTFEKYTGAKSLNNLPGAPDIRWQEDPDIQPTPPDFKTDPSPEIKKFIVEHTANSCERFHINFWFGNYSANTIPSPPPGSRQEVIVTNFEFEPAKQVPPRLGR